MEDTYERETVMELTERVKQRVRAFGSPSIPPPVVKEVSYSPETSYTIQVEQEIPRETLCESDAVSGSIAYASPLSCDGSYVSSLMVIQVSGELVARVAPDGRVEINEKFWQPDLVLDGRFRGNLVYQEPTHVRSLESPTGTLEEQCGPPPTALLSTLSKPLMYSVDVFKSLKETEYVAVCSFPVISACNSGNVRAGDKVKPYAVGKTVHDATKKLAESVTGWTARKELGIINEHLHIDQYACVHCSGNVRSFSSKQELVSHLNNSHNGNLSVDRYTNPSVANNWLVLP